MVAKEISFMRLIECNNFFYQMPIPTVYNRDIGHLEDVKLRRKGTKKLWSCFICRVKDEHTGDLKLTLYLGWNKIVKENEIMKYEAVSFTYSGNSVFTFIVYGRDSVIKLPNNCAVYRSEDEEADTVVKGTRGWLRNWHGTECGKAAEAFLANSDYEGFISQMAKGYEVDRYLKIPPYFVKNCLHWEDVDELLVVIQDDFKDWMMVIRFYKRSDGALYKCLLADGFKDFATNHHLRKNAVLAFKMLTPPTP